MLDKCQSKITCKLDGCTKRHHTLLHRSKVIQPAKSSPLVGQNNGKNHHSSISKIALLQTIPVILFNGNYEIQINALLDSASDVTLTHEAGAQLEGERGGGLHCPFSKIGENCPNLEKKCPDFGHLWVKFLI